MVALPKALWKLYKIEPLDGTNYKRWPQKLLVYFEQLKIDYVLTTAPLDDSKITVDVDFTKPSTLAFLKTPSNPLEDATKKKLEKDNKVVESCLLNYIANPLFDLFVNFKYWKLIWIKLDAKYGSDDVWKKNISSASGCCSRLQMKNQSWNKFIRMRICLLRF